MRATSHHAGPDARALGIALQELYTAQLKKSDEPYLRFHSAELAIRQRVASFMRYAPFVPRSGAILDWGCHHAPDASLLRAAFPLAPFRLIGCDFPSREPYAAFWEQSRLEFVAIDHPFKLPFEHEAFDCVIAAGTLEHTVHDYESLKELHRALKNGAPLIITHLPNRFSYVEFAARHFRKRDFHRKLYSMREIVSLLNRSGFYPTKTARHRMLPAHAGSAALRLLIPAVEGYAEAMPGRQLDLRRPFRSCGKSGGFLSARTFPALSRDTDPNRK